MVKRRPRRRKRPSSPRAEGGGERADVQARRADARLSGDARGEGTALLPVTVEEIPYETIPPDPSATPRVVPLTATR